MHQLTAKPSEPPSRNFETDVPRAELNQTRNPVSNRLWAGMAAAAVVSAVGVGSLAGPVRTAEVPLPPEVSTTAAAPAEGPAQAEGPAPVPAPPDPAPAPAPAPAPSGDSNRYTVVPGDTVGGIAARYGVDLNAMLAANGLGAYSIIVPGQSLVLTGPAVAAPTTPGQAAPAVRTIYVAGAGGQAMVDACIGPIHFTPNDGYSLFITEHDFCGGWARFSGIAVGETISIPGYGTYTATARGQVPNPGTTNDVKAVFGGFPRAILQTCIPGTSQMLLIALN